MKFNMVIEVEEAEILESMEDNGLTRDEAIWRITNNLYMGLSCIDAMLHRDLSIETTESYVERG